MGRGGLAAAAAAAAGYSSHQTRVCMSSRNWGWPSGRRGPRRTIFHIPADPSCVNSCMAHPRRKDFRRERRGARAARPLLTTSFAVRVRRVIGAFGSGAHAITAAPRAAARGAVTVSRSPRWRIALVPHAATSSMLLGGAHRHFRMSHCAGTAQAATGLTRSSRAKNYSR